MAVTVVSTESGLSISVMRFLTKWTGQLCRATSPVSTTAVGPRASPKVYARMEDSIPGLISTSRLVPKFRQIVARASYYAHVVRSITVKH